MNTSQVILVFIMLMILSTNGFNRRLSSVRSIASFATGPRPIHTEFTVEKATPEKKDLLNVVAWPTWSTAGSTKYQTGVKSPLKVYDTNELSYIISGKMEITPVDDKGNPGTPALVQAGDFVTFPDGFSCYWFVIETVKKHWYLY